MSESTEAALRNALRAVRDPYTGEDVVSAGLVDSLRAERGIVHLALRTDRHRAPAMEAVRQEAQKLLARQPGVLNATAVLTAHREQPQNAPENAPVPAPARPAHQHAPLPPQPQNLPGIKHVVAVASGKGGVGKSTLAVNLAVALQRQGRRIGLLDADIYGPSLPRMLGVAGKPEVRDKTLVPAEAWGLRAMSMGLLVDQDTAMVWRGPMVMGAITQLLEQVAWGTLDALVVDLPPGTGDAQLTLSQKARISGAVIVSTPQDIALMDARRGVRMFEKVHVPVLGIVENMSMFCCPNCGHETPLFGHGGARHEAERLGVPFLGEVPLLLAVREGGDKGVPVVASEPDSAASRAFDSVARAVWARLPA
jgi:ATP-binding protein involved in chromosome partitioning